ncbi:T9SS type A sorting domain-containing protein [bacterium]|nr:T9SS type A sorting domain-containing protein [bacterium]
MAHKGKVICILLAIMTVSLFAADDFDLQFVVITNDQVHFDVKVQIKRNNTDWDKLGDANFSFDYNTSALSNASLLVAHNFSGTFYETMTVTNPSNASVNIELLIADNGIDVTTGWMDVATVRFDVDDAGQSSNLVWLGSDVTFSAFDDDNTTLLDPGVLNNLDVSLPVQMTDIQAESTVEGIELSWTTQSEVNSMGFHVWRSDTEDGEYELLTTSLISSQGNNSSGAEYTFVDANVETNGTLYYKIEEKGADGSSQQYGPISVEARIIPEVFALEQNYPNPFNPLTTFTYDVPEIADVTIKVYSLLGKEVTTIYSKQQMPGRYTETWDGTNNRGQKLASGVYFLRMQAADFVQMRKMTLIR